MTLQTATYSNFFETTLNGIVASGANDCTLTAAPTSNGTTPIAAPYYLVIDPDNASNREVVLVTASSGTTVSAMTRDVEGRYTTDPTHVDGTTVRMAVVGEMFEDIHDRVNDIALTGDITGTISSSTQDIATSFGSGVIVNADVNASAAIDASKIHNGNVSNTEFGYLDGVSSAIQTQIDNISAGAVTLTVPITVKVADDGSGSQNVFYFLSGTDSGAGTRSSNFIFKIGFKYKFDTSDSSLATHNFKFSLTQDGSHNGGSEFTTNVTTAGTPGSSGSSTTIEITPETLGIAGATSTLYYYCSSHSGMGGDGAINLYSSGGGDGDIHGFLLMGA